MVATSLEVTEEKNIVYLRGRRSAILSYQTEVWSSRLTVNLDCQFYRIETLECEGGKMPLCGKCLPHQHEDLNLIPSTHIKAGHWGRYL